MKPDPDGAIVHVLRHDPEEGAIAAMLEVMEAEDPERWDTAAD